MKSSAGRSSSLRTLQSWGVTLAVVWWGVSVLFALYLAVTSPPTEESRDATPSPLSMNNDRLAVWFQMERARKE